jgi:hypothetical protein
MEADMGIANGDEVSAIVDEALDEAIGRSNKKWALVLLALVAGATVAFWMTRRARSTEPADAPAEVPTT